MTRRRRTGTASSARAIRVTLDVIRYFGGWAVNSDVINDYVDPSFGVFSCTPNGGRQFLRNRRSTRHMVSLYGKHDGLFTQRLQIEMR